MHERNFSHIILNVHPVFSNQSLLSAISENSSPLRGGPFDFWGGGGVKRFWKKCAQCLLYISYHAPFSTGKHYLTCLSLTVGEKFLHCAISPSRPKRHIYVDTHACIVSQIKKPSLASFTEGKIFGCFSISSIHRFFLNFKSALATWIFFLHNKTGRHSGRVPNIFSVTHERGFLVSRDAWLRILFFCDLWFLV